MSVLTFGEVAVLVRGLEALKSAQANKMHGIRNTLAGTGAAGKKMSREGTSRLLGDVANLERDARSVDDLLQKLQVEMQRLSDLPSRVATATALVERVQEVEREAH